jgi:hypothetical protein
MNYTIEGFPVSYDLRLSSELNNLFEQGNFRRGDLRRLGKSIGEPDSYWYEKIGFRRGVIVLFPWRDSKGELDGSVNVCSNKKLNKVFIRELLEEITIQAEKISREIEFRTC